MDYSEKDFENQIEVLSQIDALRKEKADIFANRQSNIAGSPALKSARLEHENSKKSSLKSDLKKSNAFVKRLKAITVDGIQQCIRFRVLDLFNFQGQFLKLSQGNGNAQSIAIYL